VLVLLIGVGDWLIISMEKQASFAAFETAGLNLTRGMTAQTSRMLGKVDSSLQMLADGLGVSEIANAELVRTKLRTEETASLLRERLAQIPGVISLTLVDESGHLASSAGGAAPAEINLSKTEFFAALADHADPGPFVSAPERDAARGVWVVRIARSLTDARNQFAGILLASLSLDEWEDFYRVAMPPHRALTVMRPDGLVILQYPRIGEPTNVKAEGLTALKFSKAGCTTFHGADLTATTPVVAGVCNLKNMPLLIESSALEADALAGWNIERLWLILGGVLASFGVVALLRIFANQVDRLKRSELSLAEEKREAQTAHRQLDVALSNIPQGVCFFDSHNRLVVSNRRYAEIYRLREDLVRPGALMKEIVSQFDATVGIRNSGIDEHVKALSAIARGNDEQPLVLELNDGRTIAIQVRPMTDGGWIATHEDITERRKAEQQIAFLAKHDTLTGLANRSLLLDLIEKARNEAKRGQKFALMFLDLDRFKAVNDTLGHGVGDALLRQVAERLVALVGDGGAVARLGGDEFVVLQYEFSHLDELVKLARRIVETIAAPYAIADHEIVIGVSVGVEIAGAKPATAEALLKHADTALYMAKSQGRGTFRFFEPEMDQQLRGRDHLEDDLRRALAERQFELEYQPIVDAASGEVTAFEALLRWNHPERGRLTPADFLAVAEDCGLIVPIGEWVIQQACWQAAQWPNHIRIAINLLAPQFRAVGIVPLIRETIAATDIRPERLEFEVGEAVLLQNNERNRAILRQLQDVGVGLVLTDFGAGYSSLSYLCDFPVNRVKIQRSFIRDLTTRSDAAFFLRATVDLCRNLGILVTAEGVESLEQLALLLDEGCGLLQGYFIGRPGPGAVAIELIGAGRLIPARETLATAARAKVVEERGRRRAAG
jgi:diguanylate cyclase (GGDEF)-like protein